MKPHIDKTEFGAIEIDGRVYHHDVIIGLDGTVGKRKKRLSRSIYGTSHKVSVDEIKYVLEEDVKQIVVGSGQYGRLDLSEEAVALINAKHIEPVSKLLRLTIRRSLETAPAFPVYTPSMA